MIEQDKAGQNKYGILQHVETVTGQINQPQLQKEPKYGWQRKRRQTRSQKHTSVRNSRAAKRSPNLFENS